LPNFSKLIHLRSEVREILAPTFKHTYKDQRTILLVKSEGILTNVDNASEGPYSVPTNCHQLTKIVVTLGVRSGLVALSVCRGVTHPDP